MKIYNNLGDHSLEVEQSSFVEMKFLLIITLAVAAVQAVSGEDVNHRNVIHREKRINEIGTAPKYPASRITGGDVAERGQFPYQAALYLTSSAGTYFCGGSLISTRWVLTAAHCATGIDSFTVYLGSNDISAANEEGRVVVQTTEKIVHSGYNGIFATNDIALIDLQEDVSLSKYIEIIELATGSDLYEDEVARASGWGRISDASTGVSPVLNWADLIVIANSVCRNTYGIFNIRASIICTAFTDGKGVCNGDSGGPLVHLSSGKQIGIANFVSSAGCESGAPHGFARVTSFIDWISANTGLSF